MALEIKREKKSYINLIQDLQIDDLDDIFQKENKPDAINITVYLTHQNISSNLTGRTTAAIKRSLKNMTTVEQDKVSVF